MCALRLFKRSFFKSGKVSEMSDCEKYMRLALELADRAAEAGEAPVGCVIVRDGKVVGQGYNRRESDKCALAHAEIIAINDACRTLGGWRLVGCEMYVTLEPCPMCTGAIINARLPKVFFGAYDPKAGSCASVVNLFDLPYNHKSEVVGGVLGEECAAKLTDFFRKLRKKREKGED